MAYRCVFGSNISDGAISRSKDRGFYCLPCTAANLEHAICINVPVTKQYSLVLTKGQ